MKYFRITLFILAFLILPVAFQNCGGQVRLMSPEISSYVSAKVTASGEICLPANEVFETLVVRNINAKAVNGFLQMDSDGDGISDVDESAIGTNPLSRRTGGKVLDSICQQVDYAAQCDNVRLTCTGALVHLGITDCDIESLQLNTFFDHPDQGLDTDKDGIADFLEIAAGTFPNVNDSSADIDQDNIPNLLEHERGSNPRQPDEYLPLELQIQVSKTKLPPSVNCAGDVWAVVIKHIPLATVKAYSGDVDSKFNHLEDQNLIFFTLKTRPRAGTNINAKMYLYVQKLLVPNVENPVDQSFNFTFTDFEKLGEIEP